MNRRNFLLDSLGLTTGSLFLSDLVKAATDLHPDLSADKECFTMPESILERRKSKYSHQLPATDQNYKRSKNYIEDDPITEYNWTSDEASEAFLDMKYGVRLHWGFYSIWHLSGKSWPFPGNRIPDINFEKWQEYLQLYKTTYAHCYEWPGEPLILRTVEPRAGSKIVFLGTNTIVDWKFDSSTGLVISTPKKLLDKVPEAEQLAFTFQIEI